MKKKSRKAPLTKYAIQEKWTEDKMVRILSNPMYCINIHPVQSTPHDIILDKDTWINACAKLIKDIGAKRFLTILLENLETPELPFGYVEEIDDELIG